MQITGAVLEEIGRPGPYQRTRPLTLSSLELDPPQAGEILVRIEIAGLCHSDLSVVDGNRPRPVPMLLGHEAAGIVEQIGTGVNSLTVGDRVVLTFLPRCGSCEACLTDGIRPCIPGSVANGEGVLLSGGHRLHRDRQDVAHHVGVSAFATHAVLDARSVVRVDPDVPAEVAALLGCAVLTGGGAVVNVIRPRPGDRLVIVGLGGVGMAALLVALAHDGVEVIAIDTLESKLAKARQLGAVEALTPTEALAQGLRAGSVIEAAGSVRALETAVAVTGAGGRTVTVGLPAPDARLALSPTALVAEGRTLIGSYLGSAVPQRDIPRFVELWRTGRLPLEELVSARVPLADINNALDELSSGRALRQMILVAE